MSTGPFWKDLRESRPDLRDNLDRLLPAGAAGKLKITATPCRAADLKPGELFHNLDQTLWDLLLSKDTAALGQKVYVRTEAPVPADEAELEVYRVTVEGGADPRGSTLLAVLDAQSADLKARGELLTAALVKLAVVRMFLERRAAPEPPDDDNAGPWQRGFQACLDALRAAVSEPKPAGGGA